MSIKIRNFINGQLVEPINKNHIDNIDPAQGRAYGLIPDSDEHDLEIAVNAAELAFESWKKLGFCAIAEL